MTVFGCAASTIARLVSVVTIAAAVTWADRAEACGASCPIAVSGLAEYEVTEPANVGTRAPPRAAPLLGHVRLNYWTLDTTLLFDGATPDAHIEHKSVAVSVERSLSPRWVLQLGLGAVLGGEMRAAGRSFEIKPGVVGSAVASYRWLDGEGYTPFVLLNAGVSTLVSKTVEDVPAGERTALTAFDIRLGVTVGKTFFNLVSPYAALRTFGGPTLWRWQGTATYGGDHTHVQAALGMSVSPLRRVDVFGEWAPLGEMRFVVGAGVAF